jgi:hypothetical protein
MRLFVTAAFLIVLEFNAAAQQHSLQAPKNQPNTPISSITNLGDSISINQMVILNNKNLDPFIHSLQLSKMKLSYKSDGIPAFIKMFLQSFSRDRFNLANPGENWNCCDDNHDDKLPDRKLICQGNDGHLFLISYLTGGIGEINHLVLIKYNGITITDFWTGTLWKNPTTKSKIIDYLNKNKKKNEGLNTNIITL